jgi:acyl-CoA reductase-like NAD-dependent aldehyde dehydrogenase
MTTALEPELTTYRWSSNDPADRFPVEDPATGEVITLVQGGGAAQVNAAVEAACRVPGRLALASADRARRASARGRRRPRRTRRRACSA